MRAKETSGWRRERGREGRENGGVRAGCREGRGRGVCSADG